MERSAVRSRHTSDLKSHKKLDQPKGQYTKLFVSLLLKIMGRPLFAPRLLSNTCIWCLRHHWGRDIVTDRDADCHVIKTKLLDSILACRAVAMNFP
jgi:hypothetical protein